MKLFSEKDPDVHATGPGIAFSCRPKEIMGLETELSTDLILVVGHDHPDIHPSQLDGSRDTCGTGTHDEHLGLDDLRDVPGEWHGIVRREFGKSFQRHHLHPLHHRGDT